MKKFIALLLCFLIGASLLSCNINVPTERSTAESNSSVPNGTSSVTVPEYYSGILNMYKKIVNILPTYEDTIPSKDHATPSGFTNKEDAELFNELLYSAYLYYPGNASATDPQNPSHKRLCGYAVKDLNNDGVDELVLLNDDYTLIAVFTCCDGKPLLLDTYSHRSAGMIDGIGRLHTMGSSSVGDWTHMVYNVNIGGSGKTLVAHYGFERKPDNSYKYYQYDNGQKKYIDNKAFEELRKTYLVYNELYEADYSVNKTTHVYSGLKFKSIIEENNAFAMEMYQAVLSNKALIEPVSSAGVICFLSEYEPYDCKLSQVSSLAKAVVDVDGNGIDEVVLKIDDTDLIILYYRTGKVHCRLALGTLMSDGSLYWKNSESEYGASILTYDGNLFINQSLWHVECADTSNAKYYIGKEQVSKQELDNYLAANSTEPLEYTAFTPDWKNPVTLEKALEIASLYFGIKEGDIDEQTGEYIFLSIEESKNKDYRISLVTFKNISHIYTRGTIYVNCDTGEVYQLSEGKG